MKLIGLCGQSGSGKSELCRVLSARGITCIDCDKLTRSVQGKDSPCVREMARAFGDEILLPDGALDRAKTARIVFADPEKLKLLNEITHKYVLDALHRELERYRDEPFVIADAPTLFESGLYRDCDFIAGIVSKDALRRVMERDGLTQEAAKARLNNQKDRAFLEAHCDLVLENDADLYSLDALADRLIEAIQTEE